jgi:transposase
VRLTTFLRKILLLATTLVEGVQLEKVEGRQSIIVQVRARWRRVRCGGCGRKAPCLHGRRGKQRRWRHLGIFGQQVYLACQVFRVHCPRCGVKTMAVPWARTGSVFTRAFENEVAWFLQHADQTTTARYFGISWRTAGQIARRVVAEELDGSLLKDLRFLGVDEISYGRPRKFLTVVVDHEAGRVVWAAEGQSSTTLGNFFEQLGEEQCAQILLVSIDMDEAFRKAIKNWLPNAEIVYDRFHIVQLLNRAVDEVRRAEVRNAPEDLKSSVKGSRWPLLKNPWNLTRRDDQKLSTVQRTNAPLYRGYLLKETFQAILSRRNVNIAEREFQDWYGWARRSRLEPFKRLANTFRDHWAGIRHALEWEITNGPVEGFNSKIRMISHRAFGFHSAEALIAMILLCCSGITLSPMQGS